MKVSILITLLILVVGFLVRSQDSSRLLELRETHTRMVAELEELGLSTDAQEEGTSGPARLSDRDDSESSRKANEFADELIAFMREMEAADEVGGDMPDREERTFALIEGVLDLSPDEMAILVGRLRAATGIKEQTRIGVLGFSITLLAEDHPEAALGLLTESRYMLEDSHEMSWVIGSTLEKFATQSPIAALDWIRERGGQFSDHITENTKRSVITGAARSDPAFAISLIEELGIENKTAALDRLAQQTTLPEDRLALLKAVREMPDAEGEASPADHLLKRAAAEVAQDGFDSALKWIEQATLSASETKAFIDGLRLPATGDETGKWLDWMGGAEELPDEHVAALMHDWTQKDYRAAGEWLNGTEEGPLRDTAVLTYATAVTPYDPAGAADWAEGLPDSADRTTLMNSIHAQWAQTDPAAAAAYARKHRLSTEPTGEE